MNLNIYNNGIWIKARFLENSTNETKVYVTPFTILNSQDICISLPSIYMTIVRSLSYFKSLKSKVNST